MSDAPMRIANLDETQISTVQKLEEETGAVIVALEPHFLPAPLSQDQLAKLRALEQEMGVVLLAYRQP